jgi:hypothetical protein
MRPIYFVSMIAALAFLPGLGVNTAFAQSASGGQNGGGQNGGQNDQQLSREERFYNGIRQTLEVSDDAEWKLLMPKIAKVQALSRLARDLRDTRRSMERLKSVKRYDPNDSTPYYIQDLADRAAEVRAAWDDKDAHANTIQQALRGYREAREKADKALSEELLKARGELRDLVTARQELALIMAGLLD